VATDLVSTGSDVSLSRSDDAAWSILVACDNVMLVPGTSHPQQMHLYSQILDALDDSQLFLHCIFHPETQPRFQMMAMLLCQSGLCEMWT
jgi:hypothetical protein